MIRMPSLVFWLLAAAGVYAFLFVMANRAVYYPMRHPQGYWDAQAEVGAADVCLEAGDGVRLHGWWLASPGASLATLFLHGNAGNLTHRAARMKEIAAAGSSILVIDYRGYGKSEGRPSESGLYRDAEAGYLYLAAQGFPPERILLHGESLGTAVAVELARRRPAAAVILESPFTSARDMAGRVLPLVGPLLVWGYNTRSKIGLVRRPLLVIHGNQDEIVPFEMGRAVFEAAAGPKWFWEVAGAGHNDIVDTAGPRYRQRLTDFYRGLR